MAQPAVAFANASDLDAFTGRTETGRRAALASTSPDVAEAISTEEAADLLNQFLSPETTEQRQPAPTPATIESATLSGLTGNTKPEIGRAQPSAPIDEDADVMPVDATEQPATETFETKESTKDTADSAQQKDRLQALRHLQQCVQQAKTNLQTLQAPLVGKAPRSLQKSIDKLDTIDSAKFDQVVAQLNTIAKSKSLFAVQTLRDYAASRQTRFRQAAVEGLAEITAPRSAITLLDLLQDDTAAVSAAAVSGIARMGFVQTVPVLVALGRVDGRSRALMRDQLSNLQADVREQLITPLKNVVKTKGDPVAAAFAVSLLSQLKGHELLKMYVALTRHPAAPVRVAAIEALVHSTAKQGVRFLNASITDPAASVRAAAAAGMAKLSSPRSESLLIAALADEQASVRRIAAQTLVEFESKAVAAAAASKALNLESNPDVVEFLLEIVGRGGTDEALTTLQQYMESDDRNLQHRAMATLRRLKNPRSANLVAPFLKNEHHETRRLAVETVGQLQNKSVLPELRETLRTDSEKRIRAAAARALGELKDDEAACLLEESLHDRRTVRCQAVIALGLIGSKESVAALVAQLRDPAAEVRYHACCALGQIGELPEPEPLQNLLADSEAMVRRGAETALNKMGHKVAQAKLARRLRKITAFMMPSVVAGALPGGTAMIVTAVLLVTVSIGYQAVDTVGAINETAFPVSDVHAIAMNHDGSQISVARKFNVLEVWDVLSGQLTAQFQADAGAAGIVYCKNGNALILAGPKSFELDVTRVAAEGNQALTTATLNNLTTHRVATTPDSTKTLLCTATGKATLIDMTTQQQLLSFQVQDFGTQDAVAISADATLAFVGTAGGHLKVFSLLDGKPVNRLDIGQRIGCPGAGITALVMDTAGTTIAVGTSSGSVVVVGVQKMDVVGKPYAGAGSIIGLAFQADSKRLNVVTSRRKLVTCTDDFASSRTLSTSLSETPQQVTFSANGHVAAFFYSESDKFCVVDLANDRILTAYPNLN